MLAGAGDGVLEVFGEAAVAIEPGQGSFDDPSTGQDLEALSDIAEPDDLQGPFAEAVKGHAKFGSAISGIRKHMAESWEGSADNAKKVGCAVPVLDTGAVENAGDEPTAGVADDMAFPSLHLFVSIKAPGATAFGGPDRLAVDDAGARAGLAPLGLAGRHDQQAIDGLLRSVIAPSIEVALHRRARRELLRKQTQRATCPQHVEDRVHHLAQISLSGAPERPSRGQMWRNQRPLRIRHVGCVAQIAAVILRTGGFSRHLEAPSVAAHSYGITRDRNHTIFFGPDTY